MANSRYVNTNFWKDNYVAELDPTEKIVFLYLLTNPRTTIAGIYEINIREIAFDTGIDKDMVLRIMERFENDEKIVFDNGWVVLLNFMKHQSLNPKTETSVLNILSTIPAPLSTKLARVSTYLVHVSPLLLKQRLEEQNMNINSSESKINMVLLSAIDSLSDKNTILILDKDILTTNVVSMAKTPDNDLEKPVEKRIPSAEINDMFANWELTIGYKIESQIKRNRFACSNLLKKHGRDGVLKLIQGVKLAKEDRYAPRIADFCALQSKYNDLISWGQSRNNSKPKTGVIR